MSRSDHQNPGLPLHVDPRNLMLDNTQLSNSPVYSRPRPSQRSPDYSGTHPYTYQQQQIGGFDASTSGVDPLHFSNEELPLDPQQTAPDSSFDLHGAFVYDMQQPLGYEQDTFEDHNSNLAGPYEAYTSYDPHQTHHTAAQPQIIGYGQAMYAPAVTLGGDRLGSELHLKVQSPFGQSEDDAFIAASDLAVAPSSLSTSQTSDQGQMISTPPRGSGSQDINQRKRRRMPWAATTSAARRQGVFELALRFSSKAFIDTSCGSLVYQASKDTEARLRHCLRQVDHEVDRFFRGAVHPSYRGEPEGSPGVPVMISALDSEGRPKLHLVREGYGAQMVTTHRTPFRVRGSGSSRGMVGSATDMTNRERSAAMRTQAYGLVSAIKSKVFIDRSCGQLIKDPSVDAITRLKCAVAEVSNEMDRFGKGARLDTYIGEPAGSKGVPVLVRGTHRNGKRFIELLREPMESVENRKAWGSILSGKV